MPIVVKNDLGGQASSLGFVFGAGGMGAVVAAAFFDERDAPRPLTAMYLAWALGMLGTAGFGLVTTVWQAMAVAFVTEGSITYLVVVWVTLVQRLVPDRLLGRVFALDWMISTMGCAVLRDHRPDGRGDRHDATLIWAGVLGGAVTIAFMFVRGRATPSGTARSWTRKPPSRLRRLGSWSTPRRSARSGRLRLCLGTMNFGPHTPEDESHRIMERRSPRASTSSTPPTSTDVTSASGRASGSSGTGSAREAVDERRSSWPPRCTARWRSGPTSRGCPSSRSVARARVAAASPDRLHRPVPDAPHRPGRVVERDREAMDQLKTEGKVLYVGSSNFAGWHIARANEIASKWHTVGLATEQSPYNLARRLIEMEVIPAVQEYGMGLIPYSPLAGGLLAGALKKVDEVAAPPSTSRTRSTRIATGSSAGRRPVDRRASRRCGARVAPPPAGGHRADHRPEDRGAARGIVPRARGPVGRRHPRAAGRDLPRPGRAREAYAW